jgi:hypothetical protein
LRPYLTGMSDEHQPEPWSIADTIGELRPFPRPVVWAAGGVIAVIAALGLYQGIRGGMNVGAGNGGQEEAATGDAVSAQAAQPLSSSSQWSALSGPAMASSAAPAAASSAQAQDDNEEADDSEAPAAPPPVVSAAPAQQPASAAAPTTQPASSAAQPLPEGTF